MKHTQVEFITGSVRCRHNNGGMPCVFFLLLIKHLKAIHTVGQKKILGQSLILQVIVKQ